MIYSGRKIVYIPGDAIRVTQPAAAVAVIPWWLTGGISAANCIAAYQPKGAADLAASYINLANPGTYNAAAGTAPTWDVTNGWKFLATSSQYLTTGITPATGQTWSAIVRFSNIAGAGGIVLGGNGANDYFYVAPNLVAGSVYYAHGAASLNTAPNLTSGVLALAGNEAYRNGLYDGLLPAPTGGPYQTLYIGARNNSTVLANLLTGYVQAVAIYNNNQAANIASLTTAMNAL